MKNLVSLIVFALVFLGLGAMALMAAPGGADLVAEFNPSESAGSAPQTNSAAPAATNKYNMIALPLDSTASISPFTASGLVAYHGSGVIEVLEWDAITQTFNSFDPVNDPPFPPFDFPLATGGSYMLLVDSSSSDVISFVGDVPAQGSISFALNPGTATCKYDSLSIPLDRDDLTSASELAADIGAVTGISAVDEVLVWDVASQTFNSFDPVNDPPFLPFDFAVEIGYPYMVCTRGTSQIDWK